MKSEICLKCADKGCFGYDHRVTECIDFQPMTNADRIRQMTDEELCVFLAGIYTLDTDAYGDYDPCVVIDDHKFREPNDMMDWLKSPVEEEEG